MRALQHSEVVDIIKNIPDPSILKFIDAETYYTSCGMEYIGLSIECPLHLKELHTKLITTAELIDFKVSLCFTGNNVPSPSTQFIENGNINDEIIFPTSANDDTFNSLSTDLG